MKLKESEIKLILDNVYEKYKNESFLLSQSQIQELCNKKPSIWKGESYWNLLNRVLQKEKSKYKMLFGTVNGIVFCNQTITSGETYYLIIFYNDNPFSGLNELRLIDFNDTFFIKASAKQIRFAYSECNDFDNFYISGSGLYDFKKVKELEFPCDEKISIFFNELLNKFQDILATKKEKFNEDIIKSFKLVDTKGKEVVFKFTISSLEISKVKRNYIVDLDKYNEITITGDYGFSMDIGAFYCLCEETERSSANQINGLFHVLKQNLGKNKTEILKIIDSKDDKKSLLINAFINEFDKNKDNVLDVLESKTFADILKNNQKLIIEKNPDYIHKFVKLSNYINTKSTNLQSLFIKTKEYVENNDALLIDNSIEEVDFFKGMVHSYNLILFHSVNMITVLISDDLITFYEIYESFDKLGIFNSSWENDLTQKLKNVENKLQNIIDSIEEMESQICMQLEVLTNSVESSFDSLEESVNNQLSATNSLLGFNNLLAGIQVYQAHKLNRNLLS